MIVDQTSVILGGLAVLMMVVGRLIEILNEDSQNSTEEYEESIAVQNAKRRWMQAMWYIEREANEKREEEKQ